MRAFVSTLTLLAVPLIVFAMADNLAAQFAPGEYHDSLYAADNIPPNMPKYGPFISIGGRDNIKWRIEFDVYPHQMGRAVIMARVVEEGGDEHMLQEFHWNDLAGYPDGTHLVFSGSATTNGTLRNRLEWLVQPFLEPPAFFRNCVVAVTYY